MAQLAPKHLTVQDKHTLFLNRLSASLTTGWKVLLWAKEEHDFGRRNT